MSQGRPVYSLNQLFEELATAYQSLATETLSPGYSWLVDFKPDIAGYPAIVFGLTHATPSLRQIFIYPLAWHAPGVALDGAKLLEQARAGCYQIYVGGGTYWPTGWLTSTIAPGLATALASVFGVPIGWSNVYRETVGPGKVYSYDFSDVESGAVFATWVVEFFGPTDPVVADPYKPGFNMTWAYPNIGALYWLASAGSYQNRFQGIPEGGGGSGTVDLTPVVEAIDRAVDELQVIATTRVSIALPREGVWVFSDPPAIGGP